MLLTNVSAPYMDTRVEVSPDDEPQGPENDPFNLKGAQGRVAGRH